MRVRLLTDRRCMVRGFQWAGAVVDLPRDEARRLLAAQQAELLEPEAATAAATENAARKRPQARETA